MKVGPEHGDVPPRPNVVHVTTPPTSHFRLAMDSFEAGAHAVVEKPATSTFEELETLVQRAQEAGRHLVRRQSLDSSDHRRSRQSN